MVPPASISACGWIANDWVSSGDAAWFLGVHINTLRRWRLEGRGPAYERRGYHAHRYKAGDLERWRVSEGYSLRTVSRRP